MLNKAIVFAVERHKGAFRKGTKIPYITHPLEALSIGATITNDLELLSACVLHDTLEDTNTTFNEIKEKFGLRVAKLVYFDSENKREGVSPEKTWEIRKNETLKRLETANRDEQIIVLSDKLSNLRAIFRDYKDSGEKFWDRFYCKDLNKQGWYYKSIAERLSLLTETHAYKEYCSILDEVFVQY